MSGAFYITHYWAKLTLACLHFYKAGSSSRCPGVAKSGCSLGCKPRLGGSSLHQSASLQSSTAQVTHKNLEWKRQPIPLLGPEGRWVTHFPLLAHFHWMEFAFPGGDINKPGATEVSAIAKIGSSWTAKCVGTGWRGALREVMP